LAIKRYGHLGSEIKEGVILKLPLRKFLKGHEGAEDDSGPSPNAIS
jgi:hypothetical protein